jgi:hypothetical protein
METTAELLGLDTTGEIIPGELTELEGHRPIPNFDPAERVVVVLGVGSGIFVNGERVAN